MKSAMRLFALATLVAVTAADKEDIVLQPLAGRDGPEVGLILVQGAYIHTKAYQPLAERIQASTGLNAWIGIPVAGLDNLANPAQLGSALDRIVKSMQAKGMKTKDLFIGGHSLGGAMTNIWSADNNKVGDCNVRGAILMGSFIARKYRDKPFKVPTMTLAGELDGLCRLTRISESFFHFQKFPKFPSQNPPTQFPHILNLGQTHMQFASGSPPGRVKKLDFKPEITYDQAHNQLGQEIGAYMASILGGNKTADTYLSQRVAATAEFFSPILEAYDLASNYYHVLPCNCEPDTCWSNSTSCLGDPSGCKVCDRKVDGRVQYRYPDCDCRALSRTTERWSQRLMFGDIADQITLNVTDSIHPVWQEHPHHIPCPQKNDPQCQKDEKGLDGAGYCMSPTKSCHLNFTTITDAIYEADKLDTGTAPNSAIELRTKMTARQEIYKWTHNGTVPSWNQTDGDWDSRCGDINRQILQDVLAMVPARTMERYRRLGQEYTIGRDKKVNAGNVWIKTKMDYGMYLPPHDHGKSFVEVSSVTMKTSDAFAFQIVKGYHYCKILPPDRILEWVYVDSLREYDSLTSQPIPP